MSSLNFKLQSSLTATPIFHQGKFPSVPTKIIVRTEDDMAATDHLHVKDSNNKNIIFLWVMRVACVITCAPLVLFTRDDRHVMWAACSYLIVSPLTCSLFQIYAFKHSPTLVFKAISLILCSISVILGNISAVLLLNSEAQSYYAYFLVSVSVGLGCLQLLLLLHKQHIVFVMLCTAIGVLTLTLAVIACVTNTWTHRRFYPFIFIPLVILFFAVSNSIYHKKT